MRPWRTAPADLARIRLVLSRGHTRRGWIAWSALCVIALLAGAAGSHLYWTQRLGLLQQQTVAAKDLQQVQQALEQSHLLIRVAEARSKELERQVDALSRQLRECQEEVAFFRKARDGKH